MGINKIDLRDEDFIEVKASFVLSEIEHLIWLYHNEHAGMKLEDFQEVLEWSGQVGGLPAHLAELYEEIYEQRMILKKGVRYKDFEKRKVEKVIRKKMLVIRLIDKDTWEAFQEEEGYTSIEDVDVHEDFYFDYATSVLVDLHTGEVVLKNNNMDTNIVREIECFLKGMEHAGVEVETKYVAMFEKDFEEKKKLEWKLNYSW